MAHFLLVFSQTSLPIGTILPYVGDLANIPSGWHLCDGSNGTPNLSGRFLEGVTSGSEQWHDAGLPDIYGEFNGAAGVNGWPVGAFASLGDNQAFVSIGHTQYNDFRKYSFLASRSNSIYGRSGTVQPASYTVYYIMRVK